MGESSKARVILRSTKDRGIREAVRECMEFCDWESLVPRDATVVLKPNLCSALPGKWKMANTDRDLAEAVCEMLQTRTKKVYICESSGLRHKAEECFDMTRYPEMAERVGVPMVNFTTSPRVTVKCDPPGAIEMPKLLMEADVFITLPVLKTHALTYFTGALKNQWGCLPQYDRILCHQYLDAMLVELHAMLRPKICIMDGIVGMEGRGPTNGRPRRMDVLLASTDGVALDATAMRLVGLDPQLSKHIVMAADRGLGRFHVSDIEVDGEWERHKTKFEPAIRDVAIASMDYMSRYRWFVKYALEQDYVFYPVRALVQLLRKVGVVEGG